MEEEGLVGIKAVNAHTGLAVSWLYTAAENGNIPAYKLGKYVRFRLSEIEAWIQAHRTGPTAGTNGTPPKGVRPVVAVAKPRRRAVTLRLERGSSTVKADGWKQQITPYFDAVLSRSILVALETLP